MKNLKGTICFTVGLNPPAFAAKLSNKPTCFFFVHFSVLRTVAMAITNRKDNHFLLFSAYSQTSRKRPPYNVKLMWSLTGIASRGGGHSRCNCRNLYYPHVFLNAVFICKTPNYGIFALLSVRWSFNAGGCKGGCCCLGEVVAYERPGGPHRWFDCICVFF